MEQRRGDRKRSPLSRPAARRRYVEIGARAVLRQIREDAQALESTPLAVGPFARLDAGAVAAHDGKTRGTISNLFGSQAAFQAETMAEALSAGDWIERLEYPDPAGFATAVDWVDALFAGESERGPRVGAEPVVDYASLWALWLSAVPYGLWSERIRDPSLGEHLQWLDRLEATIQAALDHFGLMLRDDTTVADVALSCASVVEGAWLTQCLTSQHPRDPSEPIATALRRAGRLLWRGAVA